MTKGDTQDSSEERPSGVRVRLASLVINRFRNVAPGTTLGFDEGFNVLLGRNGTGKTTLLELVAAIVGGDLRAYRRDDFDLAYVMEIGAMQLAVHVVNSVESTEDDRLPQGLGPERWSYHFELSSDGTRLCSVEVSAPGTVAAEPSEYLQERGITSAVSLFMPLFWYVQFLMLPMSEHEPNVLQDVVFEASEQVQVLFSSSVRLDEGLDVFRRLMDGAALRHEKTTSLVVESRSDPKGRRNRGSAYAPRELVRISVEEEDSVHEKTELVFDHERLGVLASFKRILAVSNVRLTMGLIARDPTTNRSEVQSTFGKPVVRVTTPEGTTFTHEALSYGERRLFAFLWHAAANPEVLVADELVNGLHHEWIQECLDAIEGQAFLTSQNPLLLDHLPFESAEEVRRRFVLCDRDDEGNWVWRNMSEELAGSFYRAYEVGIQHVSEILRAKGIW